MLSESFVASLLTANSTPTTSSALKDVGICVHEFRPNPCLQDGLKKSSTERNCLAISGSHIFTVQTGKAVVHVFNRERNNQEATVPFPERLRSIAIAGASGGTEDGGIVVLGTEGGKLIMWEVCTGRQILTPATHLQPVTSLAIDPTNNFIISGSEDSSVHVWSLPDLLSFSHAPNADQNSSPASYSPMRTISNHTSAITSIAVGHSINRSNIAVSTSRDGTIFVWEYRTGRILHTYLVPLSPLSVTIDAADRAIYVGYEDGSVQLIDFFRPLTVQNTLYDPNYQNVPTQLSKKDIWTPPSADLGAALSLTLSYDGANLLSGHKSGAVVCWDIGRARYSSTVANFNLPVTNIQMLTPSGLLHKSKKFTTHTIVKPRFDHALSGGQSPGDAVPSSYIFQAHINSSDAATDFSSSALRDFSAALSHPSFPPSLISETLLDLYSSTQITSVAPASQRESNSRIEPAAPVEDNSRFELLEAEIQALKKQVSTQEAARQSNMAEILELRDHVAGLEDFGNELLEKQQAVEKHNRDRQVKKEERALKRREAWFEAEKRGRNGDMVVKDMEMAEESSNDSEMSSDN
ncbi:Pre-rRNA-processing protein ipi3 [Myotisia sp. PD_48]|nr:Pre-rRNA-processing protein ipi3 [Myotisia sp. PD_48]